MQSDSNILEHMDMCLYYVDYQQRINKVTSCVSRSILEQDSPKSAIWLASTLSLPEFSSWIASKAELNIICFDDSALAHSKPFDMLRCVEKWTGAHVYE
jgi:hypothetical protein